MTNSISWTPCPRLDHFAIPGQRVKVWQATSSSVQTWASGTKLQPTPRPTLKQDRTRCPDEHRKLVPSAAGTNSAAIFQRRTRTLAMCMIGRTIGLPPCKMPFCAMAPALDEKQFDAKSLQLLSALPGKRREGAERDGHANRPAHPQSRPAPEADAQSVDAGVDRFPSPPRTAGGISGAGRPGRNTRNGGDRRLQGRTPGSPVHGSPQLLQSRKSCSSCSSDTLLGAALHYTASEQPYLLCAMPECPRIHGASGCGMTAPRPPGSDACCP